MSSTAVGRPKFTPIEGTEHSFKCHHSLLNGVVLPPREVKSWIMRLNTQSEEYKKSLENFLNPLIKHEYSLVTRVNDKKNPILTPQEVYYLQYAVAQQNEGNSTGWKLPESPDGHFEDINKRMETHVMIDAEGNPVGIVQVTQNPGETEESPNFYLEYFGVTPVNQGKGVGRIALLSCILDIFERFPKAQFDLDTAESDLNAENKAAFDFYKSLGFLVIDESIDTKCDTRPWYEATRERVSRYMNLNQARMAKKLREAILENPGND